jgi:putative phosphoribosyl transferase
MRFADRRDAGRRLAPLLDPYAGDDTVVVGLPRGGVPVAAEVADHLGAPLDVLIVRKIGVPYQPELAMGAIGEGGVRVLNQDVIRRAQITAQEWSDVEVREWDELERRSEVLRQGHPRIPLEGKTVIIVDDGIATGSTAQAACRIARAQHAARVVLAVPVGPQGWEERFVDEADEFVCVTSPRGFMAVGQWYDDFAPTTDADVVDCLAGRR